jgi:hypothetical protein
MFQNPRRKPRGALIFKVLNVSLNPTKGTLQGCVQDAEIFMK